MTPVCWLIINGNRNIRREPSVYANSSIGLFAHLAAAAGGTPYAVAFSQLTTSLKLTQTYLQVPKTAEAHYAWVMTKEAEADGRWHADG